MRDLLTGRQRVLSQALDGLLHDAQPPASIGIAAAQIGADGRPLVEPGAFFCDGNYSLAINSWNALAGVAVTLRLRWLAADGRTTDSEFVHTPNTNRTKATSLFPLGVGFALNATLFASSGTPLIGQTFIQVQIVRGLTGAILPVATILQDYVTSVQAVAWPGSPIRSSIEGGGFPRAITGTLPGAGVEISETVPAGARWRFRSLFAQLTTNATVINRTPALTHFSGATMTRAETVNIIPASATFRISWFPGCNDASIGGAGGPMHIPFPLQYPVLAGDSLRTLTTNLQAGDQWTAPTYVVDEYMEAAS